MFARTLIATAVALAAGIPLQTFAESFNAKPGAWQMSMTTLIAGNPIPPEALANMPPEKRAKVEEAMKARAGRPITITQKTCVSQKDLDQDRIIRSMKDDSNCTRNVLSRSASRMVMEQTCPEPQASTSQMTIEATTPESLSASIVRVRGDGKGKVLIDVKGFWLGPSCAGIKDDD
jgi:Protein of unknown function (DUF3617)